MRVHVHSGDSREEPVTPALWRAAIERAGAEAAGLRASFGHDPATLAAALHEAEVLVFTGRLPRPLPPAPRLHTLFCTFAGVDRLMPLDWLPPGTVLLNNRGAHSERAGEFAIMAVLMLAGEMPRFAADQRAERWDRRRTRSVRGRRLLVVGLGGLGGEAARRAEQFGMEVTGLRARPEGGHPHCRRVLPPEALDAALAETEFLLLACPLTAATRHLLDRRRIALLPAGAGVINIGRGGLLDGEALCDALEAGALGGAVLDVFDPEPVPPGHRLWTTRNLVMTPHVSCDDDALYLPRSLDILLAELSRIRRGEAPSNRVDPARGY